ncbi:MAG: DUF3098 domain-containing protein [Bacteroidota bacterium]
MSKKPKKKKVVVGTAKKTAKRTAATPRTKAAAVTQRAMTFSKDNYLWMGIGFALVLLGMALMSGGAMPDPNTWDDDIIYSTRRTVLAPIVILAGLAVEVYAIFK